MAAKPSSSRDPSVAPRQQEPRRRQSAASRGSLKQATVASSADVLGQQVRWETHFVHINQ